MEREVYNVETINKPRTIAGVEWKAVMAMGMFFAFTAIMFKAPAALLGPVILMMFLRGPGLKDPEFLNVYRKHSHQRDFYSPAYLTKKNVTYLRPNGFNRLDNF